MEWFCRKKWNDQTRSFPTKGGRVGINRIHSPKSCFGVGGVLEKLSTPEERVVGAAGHLLDCQDAAGHIPIGMTKAQRKAADKNLDQAVKIFRAALAMWEFEATQVRAEKAMKEKDGLTT